MRQSRSDKTVFALLYACLKKSAEHVLSGGLFSATAGPLLPDNLAFKPFNKMWRSQSQDNGGGGDNEDNKQDAADAMTQICKSSGRQFNSITIIWGIFWGNFWAILTLFDGDSI